MKVSEGEGRDKGAERIFEDIMAENLPNLMGDMNKNTHIAQSTPE